MFFLVKISLKLWFFCILTPSSAIISPYFYVKEEKRHRETGKERSHVRAEEENNRLQPQIKECPGLPAAPRSQNKPGCLLPVGFTGRMALGHLIPDFQPPELWDSTFCYWSLPACSTGYSSPGKPSRHPSIPPFLFPSSARPVRDPSYTIPLPH